jgi:N-acetylglutamate synthase-like GNAT family acetyltransferase
MDLKEPFRIRTMKRGDVEAITEIDNKVLGKRREEYWETKVDMALKRTPIAPLVAEKDGRVVGFIMGQISGWEYGVPENVGWIDTIGMDPLYQRKGVARVLLLEIVNNMRKVGVDTVYTMASWRDGNMLRFFDRMGFKLGELVNLELKV